MQKKLSSLLDLFEHEAVAADGATPLDGSVIGATPIEGLAFDSREVKENFLFFALPGIHQNGNKFIAAAIDLGASVIIYQGELSKEESAQIAKSIVCRSLENIGNPQKKVSDIVMPVFLKVEDCRQVMPIVAADFFDNPSKKLIVIGVTGTEGKSSTVSFIWQLLRLMGKKAGFVSTVEYSIGEGALANPQHTTTPESPIIQRHLFDMVKEGCEYAVLECSSHGLSKKLGRLSNVFFDVAVFMNVTLEHLEFHKTFEQYRSDKSNLFRALDEHNHKKILNNVEVQVEPFAVVNLEDANAKYFCETTTKKVYGFTSLGKAGRAATSNSNIPLPEIPENVEFLTAKNISANENSLSFEIDVPKNFAKDEQTFFVKTKLNGAFNAYNIMASLIVVSKSASIPIEDLLQKSASLIPVAGRMTRIDCGQPFEVIADYAHTPSSFEVIFPPLRARCEGKIIALFGSGGERDVTKRPLQGEVAAKYCDTIILCDEDPRGEDSQKICRDIASGAIKGGMSLDENLLILPDRPKAIRKAFSMAKAGDIVLLLGKGHENTIIYKDFVMPYDEVGEAKKALTELGYRN